MYVDVGIYNHQNITAINNSLLTSAVGSMCRRFGWKFGKSSSKACQIHIKASYYIDNCDFRYKSARCEYTLVLHEIFTGFVMADLSTPDSIINSSFGLSNGLSL